MPSPSHQVVEADCRSLVEKYKGRRVRMVLRNGIGITGTLKCLKGFEAEVEDEHKGLSAIVNTLHVISTIPLD